jgi:predicted enzyme related to lactoylglutathione lyase
MAEAGKLVWFDLTVQDAERVRDFYAEVVGWRPEPVDTGPRSGFYVIRDTSGAIAALHAVS